jgi:uracil-DNA glycosylase
MEALPAAELTLLVGGHAQRWALGPEADSVAGTVARWRSFLPHVLVLPHPSWRNTAWLRARPWFDSEVVGHLRTRVAELLGR